MNGCHQRLPFHKTLSVQNGYRIRADERTPKLINIPFVMSRACEYAKSALGQKDDGCVGCKWKS